MKKSLCFIMALATFAMLLASVGPAAAYTVTGDLSSSGLSALSGSVTYTGTLSGLFDTISGEATYINNGTSDMYANMDYILATSTTGQIATFSVGEITVGNSSVNSNSGSGGSANNIQITGSSSTGFTISGNGESLSNVANIDVVHTTAPPANAQQGTYNSSGQYSPSFTILANGTIVATYSSSNFPGSYATMTNQESWASTGNKYTGVSLLALLQAAGVNTNDLNQYVIATGADGTETVVSMDEIVANSTGSYEDMVAYQLNGSSLSSTRGFARLVLPSDTSNSRSEYTLYSLDVVPTPTPAALLLFAPGLAGIAAMRKRLKTR